MTKDEGLMTTWFEDWFADPRYLKLYSHRNLVEASGAVELILQRSRLKAPADVLDLACGAGRHAVALARHGFKVTAVDLSATLLNAAHHNAEEHGVEIDFIQSDMRAIRFENRFDLVVQLFTSFGYFATREEDAEVLHHVRRALRPGGWYALDLIDPAWLEGHIVPENMTWMEGASVVERRAIEGDRVVKQIEIRGDDGDVAHFSEQVRLYKPQEIDTMLRSAGLEPVEWFGNYEGEPFDPATSPRMLILCRASEARNEKQAT